MEIQIIVDSSCDMARRRADAIGLVKVPVKLTVDGSRDFLDDGEQDVGQVLEAIRKSRQPLLTSAPSPGAYAKAMRQAQASIVVCLSSRLSGSYGAAMAARQLVLEEEPDKQIAVFDGKTASAGLTRIALKVHEMKRRGMDFEAICEALPGFIDGVRTLFVMEDLSALIKSGRMPKMVGMVGSMLMVRPIMGESGQGEIELVEKVRGTRKALTRLAEIVAERTRMAPPKSLVMTMTECECPARAIELRRTIMAICPAIKRVYISSAGGLSASFSSAGGIVLACG